jgi:ferric-dicitrate binding protein FerR (iron transport regulator)
MLVNKDTLIGKYLSGNANAEETRRLEDWLKQDAAHQAEFDRIEKFWNASLHLKKDKDADVDIAWNQFRQLTETQPVIRIDRQRYNWAGMAAAVALFIVTALMVKLFMDGAPPKRSNILSYQVSKPTQEPVSVTTPGMGPVVEDSVTYAEEEPVKDQVKPSKKLKFPSTIAPAIITIAAGDSAKIFMLPDNSVVYLNAKSKLEYPKNFNKSNRHVTLTGEAFFDVKKDSAEFVVSCENTVIKGRATMFNVKSHTSDKEVEVIVASGSVEFSGIGYKDFKKLVLKGGESGYYNKAKSEIIRSKHQRKNYKWWERKSLKAMIKAFFDKLMGKKH